ncbi:hypothetical protein JOE21_001496 [Desmospora profundinema]|uniref:Uncharacterized protein n=1 Tax=Desmospora profundinema TaxID=1571184 RepID=A0ABU1IM70_9BACL|nr:hypothetical protein [Desmospora profundinema]
MIQVNRYQGKDDIHEHQTLANRSRGTLPALITE